MYNTKFLELSCIRCGGQLKLISDNTYQCASCGKTFEKQVVTDVADQLRAVLNEQKQEAVANLRRQLWAEMHETYINSEKIIDLARDLKKYLPEDYFANFCEVANGGSDRQINEFLNNTPKEAMADYADIVLDFMLKSVTASNLTAISLFIERAFKGDTVNYDKYVTRYEEEAQKVNSGIYELILTRDVFLAYSSADIEKVLELCDYLESNGITCFLALRNLRHGRGAVDNYDRALQTAIDNCKTVVFVSSTNSRSLSCDALTKELPYIRQKDIDDAPAEYKRAYDKLPFEYMMPRVEYLIEDYTGSVAEMMTKEFFHSLEWCKSKEAVAERISKYLTETHETAAQRAERESREFQQRLEEERRKARELELRIAEAEAARVEAERNAAEQSQGGANVDYETLAAKFAEEQRKIAEEQELKRETRNNSEIKDGVFMKYKGNSNTIVIPDGVTSISDIAFYNCHSLTSITISDSVTSVSSFALKDCLLTSINVSSGNKNYKSIDGNLYSFDGKTLVRYAAGKTAKSFTIPDGVTAIDNEAFSGCKSLTNIIIPDGVISIGKFAFEYCDSLTSVTIPNSVTSICNEAFEGCSSLSKITIPDGVTSIGESVFEYCTSLISINVGSGNKNYKSIDGILYSIDGKTLLRYPMGKTAKTFTIPDGVTSIGKSAFKECKSLTSITISDGVKIINDFAFYECKSLTNVYLPNSLTTIGMSAFSFCTSLTNITIPNSVTTIGDHAFSDCSRLPKVNVPKSVISVGENAFKGCPNGSNYNYSKRQGGGYSSGSSGSSSSSSSGGSSSGSNAGKIVIGVIIGFAVIFVFLKLCNIII